MASRTGFSNGLHTPRPSVTDVANSESDKVRELEEEVRFLTGKATAAGEYSDVPLHCALVMVIPYQH